MGRLEGKVAIIVGGTSGIGAAICEAYVREGACVIPVSRHKTKVTRMVKRLAQMGNRWTQSITVDVTSERAVTHMMASILKEEPLIDIAVCTAGRHLKKNMLRMKSDEWHQVIDANLHGTYYFVKTCGAHMVKKKKGSIITVSSLGAQVALSQASAYSVSKAAVSMLTKACAIEWADAGVRVNALLPGVFPTELNKKALSDTTRKKNIMKRTPMKRLGNVGELAAAAVYLASDESSFVTGTELVVDGGFLASSGF